MTLIERAAERLNILPHQPNAVSVDAVPEKARAEQQAASPGQATAGSPPQGALEYAECLRALRLQHQITQSAVGFCKGRWSHDGTSAGHLRTMDRLCREYVRQ